MSDEANNSKKNQPQPPTDEAKKIGKNRADFMRRFFSVAVSVGFASKLRDFEFLSSVRHTTHEQLHQFVLLILAMIVVVGSWEFYFRSIDEDEKPLRDTGRFTIDIVIVSLYIVLLQSVNSLSNFLLFIDVIVALYILWDVLTIRAYSKEFDVTQFGMKSVLTVYSSGFLLQGKTGPSTTAWWFTVITSVSVLHLIFPDDFYVVTVGVAVAYLMYRLDQSSAWKLPLRLASSAVLVYVMLVGLLIERAFRII